MSKSSDRRNKKRISWDSWVTVKAADSGRIHTGMLYNLHSEGIYFECDTPFENGSKLVVMIDKMPDTAGPEVVKAKVEWAEEIVAPVVLHHYGIGASFAHLTDRADSKKELKVIPGGMETIQKD